MKTKVVFLLLMFVYSANGFSYEFTNDFTKGFYWERFPISISVSENDPAKKAELIALLDESIEEWERYSNIDLWNRVESATNVLKWSDNFTADTGYNSQTTLAVTLRYVTGPYVRKTEVTLNASHGINGYRKHLRTVIIHELGHTIGLDHSFTHGAVMAAGVDYQYDGLNNDDIEGLAEVSNQTIRRQETGYQAPGSYIEKEGAFGPSCGTISLDSSSGGGGGPMGMLVSLSLGLLFGIFSLRKKAPHFA